jgi:hypothetical protein
MSVNGQNGQTPEQVTSGLEWRQPREQGYLKTLPSGKTARLRPVTPAALIGLLGEVPDHLTPLVSDMIFGGIRMDHVRQVIDSMQPTEGDFNANQRALEGIKFANAICKIAFVEPQVVDNPTGDNQISPDDIDLSDRLFVLTLSMQPVEVLRSFRLQAGADVEAIPDSDEASTATEPAIGDR